MDVSAAFNVALFSALLISVIRLITGEGKVTTRANVRVSVGDRAELPCHFNDTFLVALAWMKGPDVKSSEVVVRYFRQTLTPGADRRYNISSNYSLVLTDTTLNDSDTYWCQLTSEGIFQSPTNLTVVPVKPATTTQKAQPTEEVSPTKTASQSKLEVSEHIPIIIGCSIGGLILLALVVLGCYFCFCKNKTPDGYSTPKPV